MSDGIRCKAPLTNKCGHSRPLPREIDVLDEILQNIIEGEDEKDHNDRHEQQHVRIYKMKMLIRFNYNFLIIIGRLHAVLLALIALVVISALVISQIENLPFGEALYFTLITGLTIGYGDIVVKTPFARLIAVLLGLLGIIFTGIVVAGAIRAVERSLKDLNIS